MMHSSSRSRMQGLLCVLLFSSTQPQSLTNLDPIERGLYQNLECESNRAEGGVGFTKDNCKCGFLADAEKADTRWQSTGAASCVDGMATTPDGQAYPCSHVDLLSYMNLNDLNAAVGSPTEKTNDVWGWTDPDSGREIGMIGMTGGLAFVDVTAPEAPLYLGKMKHRGFASPWTDMKVYENFVFLVSESFSQGMQIFNLTKLLTDTTGNGIEVFDDVHYTGFGNAHNIFINTDTGIAYVVGSEMCGGGLYMVNVTDPMAPTYAGCFDDDGYVHDTQCVVYKGPDSRYSDHEICFCCNENSLTIVDVSDKDSPVLVSRTTYDTMRYTHQGWLTEDQNYFFLGDEGDEQSSGINTRTLIANVQDLINPVFEFSHSSQLKAVDHNMYVRDDFVYQANYRAGLHILRINGRELSQVACFDIYPESNSARSNGAWSNYPFFPSGSILVSGIEQGLFVVRWDGNESPDFCDVQEDSTTPDWGSCEPNTCSWPLDFVFPFNKIFVTRNILFVCSSICIPGFFHWLFYLFGWNCGTC